MAADDVVINIRTRGGRQSARESEYAALGIRRLGTAANVASRGVANFRRNTDLSSFSLYALRRASYTVGLTVGALGAIAIKTGLQFNATMEQNQVAFTQFTGSAGNARRELGFLYNLAAKTPFEVSNITVAARQLLAFGFTAKQTNSWLATIGDTISGLGGGPEEIDRLVLAIGQISSKGRLQGGELRQLSELGVVNLGRLAKGLHLTTQELTSGNTFVKSSTALRVLQKQLDETFGGQSAKQARTFNGQLSTLHDNLSMTLGAITKPAFASLERKWLPALGSTTQRINQIFSDPQFAKLDFSQKIHLSEGAAKHRLGPLVVAAEETIREMHLGPKLEAAFEDGMTRLADTAAREAPHVAKAFIDAWWHAGPWGKFLSALWLGRKVTKGGLGLGGGWGIRGPAGAGSLANPIAVVDESSGGGKNLIEKILGGGALAKALTIGRVAGPAGAFLLGSGLAGGPFGSSTVSQSAEQASLRAARANLFGHQQAERLRGFPDSHGRAAIASNRTPLHNHIYMDGKHIVDVVTSPTHRKQLGDAVGREVADLKARR